MGIDIRDGSQLECINCGLCIDACDDVMVRIGQPEGLIAYDTEANVLRRLKGRPARFRFARPRTILYAGVLAVVSAVMLLSLTFRHTLDMDVLRDRNPEYVMQADGGVRNAYTIKVMNREEAARTLTLAVSGIAARNVNIEGVGLVHGPVSLPVEPDRVRTLRVLVSVARADLAASHSLNFVLSDAAGKESRTVTTAFVPGGVQ
jgi:polyferredoxin